VRLRGCVCVVAGGRLCPARARRTAGDQEDHYHHDVAMIEQRSSKVFSWGGNFAAAFRGVRVCVRARVWHTCMRRSVRA
jgi:hypothetical protein